MLRGEAGARSTTDDSGYAMAALLVGMAVMAVFLTVALPAWRTQAQREKESELIFRGMQYAHAIALFQRKYANAAPPSIDVLVTQRFLRKKYKDPMTKDGEFQVLLANQQGTGQPSAGGQTGAGGTVPTQGQPTTRTPTQVTTGTTVTAAGGIVGVASKSPDASLRIYNGHSKYNEWVFVATQASTGLSAPGGSQTPTGGINPLGGGPNGRGGRGQPINPGGRGTPPPGGRGTNPQGPQRGFGGADGGGVFGGGGFGGGQRGR